MFRVVISRGDETPEQTLVRELREELGIVPTDYHLLLTILLHEPVRSTEVRCHFYRVVAWDGELVNLQPAEHSELRWFKSDEVPELELADPSYIALFRSLLAAETSGCCS